HAWALPGASRWLRTCRQGLSRRPFRRGSSKLCATRLARSAPLMDRPYTVSDTKRILLARGLRAFGDGFVALLVPIYLIELGFSPLAIGAVVTSTLIGTALLTLWVGMVANRYSVRRLLLASALLMAATGAGFAVTTAFWPLLLIAFVGTMNPTSGDA